MTSVVITFATIADADATESSGSSCTSVRESGRIRLRSRPGRRGPTSACEVADLRIGVVLHTVQFKDYEVLRSRPVTRSRTS